MELFDKRFIHFMWDDELKGKTGIMSNDIKCLRDYVNNKSCTELIEQSRDESQPFKTTDGIKFRFAYYDPNYEVKKAFNEGKTIQFLSRQQQLTGEWIDVWYDCVGPNEPKFLEKVEYRVKPGEKEYRPYNNSAEMITDFIDRFKVDCPSYAEPLIWVKDKLFVDSRELISAFREDRVCLSFKPTIIGHKQLFTDYTYLNGSPCGMEVKE